MKPVFVGGTGRSGTTILRRVLGSHPDVATMPGELRIIVDPGGVLDLHEAINGCWDPYTADHAIHRFKDLLAHQKFGREERYNSHALDRWVGGPDVFEGIIEDLLDAIVRHPSEGRWTGSPEGATTIYEVEPGNYWQDLRGFVEALYVRRNQQASHWVEDTPYNSCHFNRLRGLWPDCDFIHVVRDPRDIFASFNLHRSRSKAWTSKDSEQNARRIDGALKRFNEQVSPWGEGHYYLEVRLEDMARNQEAELRRICDYLGLDWSEGLLDTPLSEEGAHIGRWKDDLSGAEAGMAMRILGPWIKQYGYGGARQLMEPVRCIATKVFKDGRGSGPYPYVHEGDEVVIKSKARLHRWVHELEIVKPVGTADESLTAWGGHEGRDLRVLDAGPGDWGRVVACLNIWNDLESLKDSYETWYPHVDHVIAVDGAYADVPTSEPASTDGTLGFLRDLDKVELIEADGFWEDQCVKRSVYFDRAESGDLLFIVDADEYVENAEQLKETPMLDVGWVLYDNPIYERTQGFPRVFRGGIEGLHYQGRHHWIYDGDDQLVTTCQRGGEGFDHGLLPVRMENTRGIRRSKGREMDARIHRQRQAERESEVGDDGVGGREPLRILHISSIDPGMVIYRMHSALNTTTPHESAMATTRRDRPYEEPTQYHRIEDRELVQRAAEDADVIHCHLQYHGWKALGVGTNAPLVIHHHGTMLRESPERREDDDHRMGASLRLVSNLELLSYGDDLHFLPNPMPVARYRRLAERLMPDGEPLENRPFRVAHSPSKRKLKGTEAFLDACDELQYKGLDIEPVLIEGQTHRESLRAKARCDAAYDSMWLGMQCSGLEAAAMGKPVIAGDETVAGRYKDRLGYIPYTFASNGEELADKLERLATDPEYRASSASRVSTYTLEVHDYSAVAARYLELLEDAVDWKGKMRLSVFDGGLSA